MLNYISAELWRMTRRRTNWLGWGIYLVLVAVTAILWGAGSLAAALDGLGNFLFAGLYLVLPAATMADGDLWRSGTLRNEVSAGLPRSRIYIGRFLSALMAGLLLLGLTIAVYLVSALALARGGGLPTDEWATLWRELMKTLPRYIGALGLAHLLCFTLRPSGLGAVLYYLYMTIGELVLGGSDLQGTGWMETACNTLCDVLRPFLLTEPYFSFHKQGWFWQLPPEPLRGWLVGGIWLLVTTALGLALFSRREIK